MSSQRAFVNARNNRRATNQGEGLSRAEKCIIARLDPNLMFLDQCSGGAAESGQRKEIREEFPEVRKQLWGGKFWEDGYFVRTVGDKVTADAIRKYIRFHEAKKRGVEQLDLF